MGKLGKIRIRLMNNATSSDMPSINPMTDNKQDLYSLVVYQTDVL